jgi:hypothetical protein
VFTWNNYSKAAVDHLKLTEELKGCKYIHFAHEKGKKGTPHLQGYVQWTETITLVQCCKRLEPESIKGAKFQVWCEVATKSKLANQKYCFKKKDTDPDWVDKHGKKLFYIWDDGQEVSCKVARKEFKRTGAKAEWSNKFSAIEDEGDLLKFAKQYPEVAIKNCHGIKTLSELIGKQLDERDAKSQYPKNLRLYKWQRSIVRMIETLPPEGRRVIWFYDKIGKGGKTMMAVYLSLWYGACFLGNGPTKDMIHAYKKEEIVLIDLCKSEEETINYKAQEAIKNGAAFSSKYDSGAKIGKRPWVFVFANMRPDRSKMAQKRFLVVNLRKGGTDVCTLEDDPEGKLKIFKENDHTEIFKNDPVLGNLIEWSNDDNFVAETLEETLESSEECYGGKKKKIFD